MPNITNVAHKAGASIAAKTRQKVMRAVEELDYRPNINAQAMKSQRSQQIGVLLQNNPGNRLTHPLAWEFVLGINEGLEQGGQIMSLVRLTDVAAGDGLQARALRSRLLDGLIVVNALPAEVSARVAELFPRTIWLDCNIWRDETGADGWRRRGGRWHEWQPGKRQLTLHGLGAAPQCLATFRFYYQRSADYASSRGRQLSALRRPRQMV